jgi:hypothetical protein
MAELFVAGYSLRTPMVEFQEFQRLPLQDIMRSWRKFRGFQWQTAPYARDPRDPIQLRRLENATWRLFAKMRMKRQGCLPDLGLGKKTATT